MQPRQKNFLTFLVKEVIGFAKPLTHNAVMNILTTEKRVAVISALVEGCSIRSTVRMTGAAKDTVLKLLAMVGQACQDVTLRNLPCKRKWTNRVFLLLQRDERARPYAGHAGRRVKVELDGPERGIETHGFMADRQPGRVTPFSASLYARACNKCISRLTSSAMI